MKRCFFIFILCIIGCNIYADEREFHYITDSIKYVDNLKFGKWTYKGWVNINTNKPTAFGEITCTQKNVFFRRTGQIVNGLPKGWGKFFSKSPNGITNYVGETGWYLKNEEVYPAGICSTLLNGGNDFIADYSDDAPSGGLAITNIGQGRVVNYYVTDGKNNELAIDKYREVMYEKNKSTARTICQQNGIKYVEEIKVGINTYSGGWKNNEPYLYGTFYNGSSVYHGYFTFNERDKSFTAAGSFYEQFSNREDPKKYIDDIYLRYEINNDLDTIINYFGYDHCWNIERKHDGSQYFELVDFTNKGRYIEAYRSKRDNPYWGIIVTEGGLWEGEIVYDYGYEEGKYGRSISKNGILEDYTISNGARVFCKYPDGSCFLSDRDEKIDNVHMTIGEYLKNDGSYTIGYYLGRYSIYDYTGDPEYGESYDQNGNLIKSYIDMDFAKHVNNIDDRIAELKEKHKTPMFGNGTMNLSNGVYTGDIKYRMRHGYGKMVYSNKNIYEGEWKDNTKEGTGIYTWSDGKKFQGEFNKDQREGKGKMFYTDGGWKEGDWKNDKFLRGNVLEKNIEVIKGRKCDYIGSVEGYIRKGMGKCMFENGDSISGEWEYDGLINGIAKLTDTQFGGGNKKHGEKCNYVGSIMVGGIGTEHFPMRHGKGICTTERGDSINGEWFYDEIQNASGVLQYKYGVYYGSIQDEIITGLFAPDRCTQDKENRLVLTNGAEIICKDMWQSCENGLWKPCKLVQFTYKSVNSGSAENVYIEKGKLTSKDGCTIITSSGDKFEGKYNVDDSVSIGSVTFANGDVLTAEWQYTGLNEDVEYIYVWKDGREYHFFPKKSKTKSYYKNADGSDAKRKDYKTWEFQSFKLPEIDFPFDMFCNE